MRRRTAFACLGFVTAIALAESPPAIAPEAVADADERPQWLPDNFFGETFGAKRE